MPSVPNVGTLAFYRERHSIETPLMLRVLKSLPLGDLSYKPHDRSASAGDILRTIVDGLFVRNDLAGGFEAVTMSHLMPPYETMASEFERLASALSDKLASLDQVRWEQNAKLHVGGQVVLERPLGELLWLFHFDLIHHRGQLSTYLRSMGSQVPSIYGRSGDETGG